MKDRLKFADQREKLISRFHKHQANHNLAITDASDSTSPLVQLDDKSEKDYLPNSLDTNENIESINHVSTLDPDDLSNSPLNDNTIIHSKAILPDDYEGPDLTIKIQQYIP